MRHLEPATRSQKLKLATLVCTALRNYHEAPHAEFTVKENDGNIEMVLTVRPVGEVTGQDAVNVFAEKVKALGPEPAATAAGLFGALGAAVERKAAAAEKAPQTPTVATASPSSADDDWRSPSVSKSSCTAA